MTQRRGDADARGVGGGQVSTADQPRQHGHDALRVGGARGGAQRGEQRGEDDRRAGEGDEGERGHRGGAQDVGEDHDHATVVAVGEHAAERSQHDLRHDARRGRDPDPHRGPGPLVDEREEGQVVQPVAGLGRHQAAEQEAEVALAQRDEERAGGVQHAITGVVGGTRAAERGSFRGRGGRSGRGSSGKPCGAPSCDEGGLRALAVARVHVHLVAPWGRRRHGQSMRLRPPCAHRAADRSSAARRLRCATAAHAGDRGGQTALGGSAPAALKPEAVRHGGGFAAACDAELAEDVRHVDARGLAADEELLGDLRVRAPVGQRAGAPRARAGSARTRRSRSRPALPRAQPPRSAGVRDVRGRAPPRAAVPRRAPPQAARPPAAAGDALSRSARRARNLARRSSAYATRYGSSARREASIASVQFASRPAPRADSRGRERAVGERRRGGRGQLARQRRKRGHPVGRGLGGLRLHPQAQPHELPGVTGDRRERLVLQGSAEVLAGAGGVAEGPPDLGGGERVGEGVLAAVARRQQSMCGVDVRPGVVIAPGERGDPGAVIEDHARERVRQPVVHRAGEHPVAVVPVAEVELRLGEVASRPGPRRPSA